MSASICRQKTVQVGTVPEAYQGIGGRALTSSYINDHVPATCDPLGPENVLIFAPGYFSGTPLVNTSRLSVGAKSPLTGGIKESNVGGTVAAALAQLRHHRRHRRGAGRGRRLLGPQHRRRRQRDASGRSGLQGVENLCPGGKAQNRHGEHNSITCIGPAGEFLLAAASIQTTDLDGRPCRAAGRGGLGAVMGAKGLKAIVVSRRGKSSRSTGRPRCIQGGGQGLCQGRQGGRVQRRDPAGPGDRPAWWHRSTRSAPFPPAMPVRGSSSLPTRSAERPWPGSSGSAGARMPTRDAPSASSTVPTNMSTRTGRYVTSSLEYETIWSMGGMIGNDDLDAIARLDFLCDDIGLDTISTGVAVAVAMDAGYKPFGDAQAAIEMVEAVAAGTRVRQDRRQWPGRRGQAFQPPPRTGHEGPEHGRL